jgi:hypothetical protein
MGDTGFQNYSENFLHVQFIIPLYPAISCSLHHMEDDEDGVKDELWGLLLGQNYLNNLLYSIIRKGAGGGG